MPAVEKGDVVASAAAVPSCNGAAGWGGGRWPVFFFLGLAGPCSGGDDKATPRARAVAGYRHLAAVALRGRRPPPHAARDLLLLLHLRSFLRPLMCSVASVTISTRTQIVCGSSCTALSISPPPLHLIVRRRVGCSDDDSMITNLQQLFSFYPLLQRQLALSAALRVVVACGASGPPPHVTFQLMSCCVHAQSVSPVPGCGVPARQFRSAASAVPRTFCPFLLMLSLTGALLARESE